MHGRLWKATCEISSLIGIHFKSPSLSNSPRFTSFLKITGRTVSHFSVTFGTMLRCELHLPHRIYRSTLKCNMHDDGTSLVGVEWTLVSRLFSLFIANSRIFAENTVRTITLMQTIRLIQINYE